SPTHWNERASRLRLDGWQRTGSAAATRSPWAAPPRPNGSPRPPRLVSLIAARWAASVWSNDLRYTGSCCPIIACYARDQETSTTGLPVSYLPAYSAHQTTPVE